MLLDRVIFVLVEGIGRRTEPADRMRLNMGGKIKLNISYYTIPTL